MNKNTYLTLSIPYELNCQLNNLSHHTSLKHMNINDFHVTFLFCGELLHKLTREELNNWNNGINEILKRQHYNNVISVGNYQLFPPNKQNLIIANINVSKDIIELQKEIVNYTNNLGGIFSEIAQLNNNWFPHCTLGKLMCGKHEVITLGNDIMNSMHIIDDTFEIDGIDVKGMMPKQHKIVLNKWN